jgi:serine/threonine protein kinase
MWLAEIDSIAMELVSGRALDTLIPPHGLRLNEALNYSVQIAAALASAHKACHPVIHPTCSVVKAIGGTVSG